MKRTVCTDNSYRPISGTAIAICEMGSGGGNDCRQDDNAHDGEFPPAPELIIGDDPDVAQQRQHHRQLEAQAEGENQHHDEIEIGLDVGHELDALLFLRWGWQLA